MNINFNKEDTRMANVGKDESQHSISLREIHIKTTEDYYYTLLEQVISKKLAVNKCW